MNEDLIVQYIGSACLFGIALIGWRISILNGETYARYGREALAVVASQVFLLMIIGLCSTTGLLSIELTRFMARLLYIVTFITLLLTMLHATAEVKVQRAKGR